MLLCFATAVTAFIRFLFVIYFIASTLFASRALSKEDVCPGSVFAVVAAQLVLWVFFRVNDTDAVSCGALPSPLSLSVLPHSCKE